MRRHLSARVRTRFIRVALLSLVTSFNMTGVSFAQLQDYEKEYLTLPFRTGAQHYALAVRCARMNAAYDWKDVESLKNFAMLMAETIDRPDVDRIWNEIVPATKPSIIDCLKAHSEWEDQLLR